MRFRPLTLALCLAALSIPRFGTAQTRRNQGDFIPPPAIEIPPPIDPTAEARPYRPSPRASPAGKRPSPASGPPGWSAHDSQRGLTRLVERSLRAPWLRAFRSRRGRRPAVYVAAPRLQIGEHVDITSMRRGIERLLQHSGRVELAKRPGKADLVAQAELIALHDRQGPVELRSYLLALSLIEIDSGRKVWLDLHRVRKLVDRSVKPPRIERLGPDRVVDLSGHFNDHDATTLVREVVHDLRRSRWLRGSGRRAVRLPPLRNRTAEHLSPRFVSLLLQHALLHAPGTTLLADLQELQLARREIRPGPAPSGEIPASHVLSVTLEGTAERTPDGLVRRYSLSLSATAVQSDAVAWAATKSLAKLVEQP